MTHFLLKRSAFICAFAGVLCAFVFAVEASGSSPTQDWDTATAHRYHFESQGTRFMPAAMLEALRTPAGTRFMDATNMRRFGFIFEDTHAKDSENPYGWPIGLAIDRDRNGIAFAGFTCAACHTAQIQYRGTTMRIEGGASDIDVAAFRRALAQSVIFTGSDPSRRKEFEDRAIALGFPRAQVTPVFDGILKVMMTGAKSPPDYVVATTPSGPGRLDALNAIATAVFSTNLGVPANAKKGDAPVRFPYLWGIWRFDWVQYNASVRQPMDRNIGEALGVGIQTHFINPATGAVNPEPLRWQSSARVQSLYWMENALSKLAPPSWPQDVLGPIDRAKALRGSALFAINCARCHAIQNIAGTSPTEWHVPVIALKKIGTDPNQAVDYAKHTFDATKLGLGHAVHTAVGLAYVVEHVKRQAYIDAGIPKSEWPNYDGFGRTTKIFPAPCGYKARPLVGVWATGPFLHNGSVPTIYDLLSNVRPSTFWFGSKEFDPTKLGFISTETPEAARFDTTLPGNSNSGHWFTNDRSRPGRIGPALSDSQKYAIIEYLKSVTPSDYPARTISKVPPAPCENDPSWADDMKS
jgi:hypothetical protein